MGVTPNILIITTDQQAHTMMSCAGNQWLATPNIDRIASRGVRFDRAYCSNPVCVPSRFSWWIGRTPSSIGMRNNHDVKGSLPKRIHEGSLGHIILKVGYRAAFGGKVHLPGDLHPTTMGFDYVCADERVGLAVECDCFIRSADDSQPWLLAANFINPHDICFQAIRDFAESDVEKRIIANSKVEMSELDELLSKIAAREEEFFSAYCPPLPPNHAPQESELEMLGELYSEWRWGPNRRAREKSGEREWRIPRWAYCRLTERVDNSVGTILDALEASGQVNDTVVIFTSDHGDHDSSHILEDKTILYEGAARVPLLIADPAAPPEICGTTVSDLSQTGLDTMATVCDYANVIRPDHNRGMSLRNFAMGENPKEWRDSVYAENEVSFMYATSMHKFVRYDAGENARQLYDLERDPYETRNWINESGNDRLEKLFEKQLEEERRWNNVAARN